MNKNINYLETLINDEANFTQEQLCKFQDDKTTKDMGYWTTWKKFDDMSELEDEKIQYNQKGRYFNQSCGPCDWCSFRAGNDGAVFPGQRTIKIILPILIKIKPLLHQLIIKMKAHKVEAMEAMEAKAVA